tara:strand:+ start:2130 stop:2519 length:390 start_codon:yes stop_codon:yes gene_type:complete
MEDLKTFLIEQIDGDNDYYAKILKGFVKDIEAYEKSNILWVARVDDVYGDSMISFGKTEAEAKTVLFKEYKDVGRHYNKNYKTSIHGQKTKAEFLDYFGAWVQPMAMGKAYWGDSDESVALAKSKKQKV